jgi:hypothetical protein
MTFKDFLNEDIPEKWKSYKFWEPNRRTFPRNRTEKEYIEYYIDKFKKLKSGGFLDNTKRSDIEYWKEKSFRQFRDYVLRHESSYNEKSKKKDLFGK